MLGQISNHGLLIACHNQSEDQDAQIRHSRLRIALYTRKNVRNTLEEAGEGP